MFFSTFLQLKKTIKSSLKILDVTNKLQERTQTEKPSVYYYSIKELQMKTNLFSATFKVFLTAKDISKKIIQMNTFVF